MGYFANGTEGSMFEEEWCATCQHGQDLDRACPVIDAHMMYAYEECGSKSNAERILDLLIERKGIGNECRMHLPLAGAVSKRQGKLPL